MKALDLLGSPAAHATGWALVHLLWQGTLLTFIAASALKLMDRQSANVRYLFASLSLLAMIVLPLVTGGRIYRQLTGNAAPVTRISPSVEANPTLTTLDVLVSEISRGMRRASPFSWKQRLSIGFERLLPWLVAAWIAGVLLLSARLLFAWAESTRLTRGATEAPRRWQQTLASLSSRLDIDSAIALIESKYVDVPMVIGWLRPVVLVPATALTGLSAEQLETILAHELAHIRRHDYAANLFQSAIETLLFYHPGVWWLSRQVRIERENCCDDIAVALCGNPVTYARALTELENLRSLPRGYAVAADGGSLRSRVVRLISPGAANCSYRWLSGVSLATVLSCLAIVMPLSLFAYQKATSVTSRSMLSEEPAIPPRPEVPAAVPPHAPASTIDVVAEEMESSEDVTDERATPEAEEFLWPVSAAAPVALTEPIAVIAPPVPTTPPAPSPAPFPITIPVPPSPITSSPRAAVAPSAPLNPSLSRPGVPRTPAQPVIPSVAPLPAVRPPSSPAAPAPALAPTAPHMAKKLLLSQRLAVPQLVYKDFSAEMSNAGWPSPAVRVAPQRWDGEFTVDQLISIRNAGVDVQFINEVRRLGYGQLSLQDLTDLRLNGVSPDFIARMNKAGFGELGSRQLIELRMNGVDPQLMDDLRALGYTSLPIKEVINLRVHGVTSEYVKGMAAAGLGELSTRDLVELRVQGVGPLFIAELVGAGLGHVRAADLIRFKQNGVDGKFVKSLHLAGLDSLSISQIIRLHASGVDANLLEALKPYRTK